MLRMLALSLSLSITGCATLGEDRGGKAEVKPPVLNDEMSLSEAVEAGLTFGGDTLTEVKKRIARKKEWNSVEQLLTKKLTTELDKMPNEVVANAIHLFQITERTATPQVVEKAITSDRPVVRQMGWQLAARNPSKPLAVILERELSRAIWDGEEEKVLIPEMAQAVQANQIRSVYTLLRQGLMTQGAEDFARAMIQVNPDQASTDFMTYLAQATIEDLRQLNQKSVNLYACMAIFRFYLSHPMPVSQGDFSHIFFYAVSRNQVLAEMAQAVLERNLGGTNRGQLAFSLARLPGWIQVAYVEGHKSSPNPNVSLFLDELKKTTAHKEVVEEIEAKR